MAYKFGLNPKTGKLETYDDVASATSSFQMYPINKERSVMGDYVLGQSIRPNVNASVQNISETGVSPLSSNISSGFSQTPDMTSLLGVNKGNNFPLFSSFDKSNGLTSNGMMKGPKLGFQTESIKTPDISDLNKSIASSDAAKGAAAKATSSANLQQGVNIGASIAGLVPEYDNGSGLTKSANSAFDTTASALMSAPDPTGTAQLVGGAMKIKAGVDNAINHVTGGATTIKDPSTGLDSIMSSSWMGPLNTLSLANSLNKTKIEGTSKYAADQAASAAFGDSGVVQTGDVGGVTKFVNKLFGKDLVGDKQADVSRINAENVKKIDLLTEQKKKNQALNPNAVATRNLAASTGEFGTQSFVAKEGTKLSKLRELKDTLKFKQGGKLKEAHNVIPSGALHAHKNHLDIEGITPKGIPVISVGGDINTLGQPGNDNIAQMQAEGGELTQHAEIEARELTVILSVTQQLEKLRKERTRESAIAAGKLLSEEIMTNTKDTTNLIEEVINKDNGEKIN